MSARPPRGSKTYRAVNRRRDYTDGEIGDIKAANPNGEQRLLIDHAIQYVHAGERGRNHVSRPFL